MSFQAILAPAMVLCGVMIYGFDAILATGKTLPEMLVGANTLVSTLCLLEPSLNSPFFEARSLAYIAPLAPARYLIETFHPSMNVGASAWA